MNAVNESVDSKLKLSDSRVDDIEWVARVIIRIHLKFYKASGNKLVDDGGSLMMLQDERVCPDGRGEEKVHIIKNREPILL